MKNFVLFIFIFAVSCLTLTVVIAEDEKISERDWRTSVIRDPSLSAKCKRMIDQRKQKIIYKQKIQSLIVRNIELQREIPQKKSSIIQNLKKNHTRLIREKELNLLKIRVLTENIIKKGCPSIDL